MSVFQAQTRTYHVGLLTLGHFLSDFYNNFLPGLLPVVVTNLGLSLTTSGLLVMVYSFASNIMQPFCGYYIDKSGSSRLILVTLPISAVFICLASIAPNALALFIFIILAGLGTSLFHPLGSSLMNKITAANDKGLAMSIFIGGGNLGIAAAPAVVIFVIVNYGLNAVLWLMIPGLILTLFYYFARLHQVSLQPAQTTAAASTAWYKSANLIKLNIVMGLRSWPQAVLPAFLPLWLVEQGHSSALVGSMLTVFLLGGAVGSCIGGYFSDKYGYKTSILGSFAVSLPALWLFFAGKEITALTWLALFITGAGLQSALPGSIVWAQAMLPDNAAMASGMMLGLSYGLGGIGAAFTGVAADIFGLATALRWSLLPLVLAIILTHTIPVAETPKANAADSATR